MKKISMLLLAFVVACTMTACLGRKPAETTAPTKTTTAPTTVAPTTTAPTIIPTMPDLTEGTNIPDPDVDTSMTNATTGTDTTSGTDITGTTGSTGEANRSRMRNR